ncbi:MAG: hypothetical protein IJT12_06910 [Paludibacteraceae bacterium]|nr:hypothetical protein [Paludibacteraceae bacterium]
MVLLISLFILALTSLSSCNPEAKAVSGLDVEIKMSPVIVSSGFMQVTFEPNKEAYYHIGIIPAEQAPDTSNSYNVRTFMALMLDKAYADYLYWRSDLLEQGTPYVAEFPTHSLQYGKVEHCFTLLEPDKDYMIFAFVVDAKTNKPDGRLFTYYLSTEAESVFEDAMQFEYRVRGYWDYVYPVSIYGDIMSWVPWVGATIDSLMLVETDYLNPLDFFVQTFHEYMQYQENDRIHFGIYAHNNDGIGDGSSMTFFDEGHTYYTGVAMMDGYLSSSASAIYKFRWEGEKTQLFFTSQDILDTEW